MDILWTLIVGGVVGWLASIVMKSNAQMGLIANIVVGIVGSVLGSWIFGLLGLGAWGPIGRLIVSVAGAMILIAILRAMNVYK